MLVLNKVVTQEEWTEAVLEAWKKDYKLGFLMCNVLGIGFDLKLDKEDWRDMQIYINSLKLVPALPRIYTCSARIMPWLAKAVPKASNAMFDGNVELAKKYISASINFTKGYAKRGVPGTEAKRAMNLDKALVVIRAREIKSPYDWDVCS